MVCVSFLPLRSLPGDQLTSKANLKLIELSSPSVTQKALKELTNNTTWDGRGLNECIGVKMPLHIKKPSCHLEL